MSFQRVKIPAGGTLQFEMPSDDPDNPDYEKNLVGVILHNHATCAYWPAGSEYDDDTTPLCSSVDGKVGIGTPGGACAACVMNRFGSAPDGSKGKACKNMRVPTCFAVVSTCLCSKSASYQHQALQGISDPGLHAPPPRHLRQYRADWSQA